MKKRQIIIALIAMAVLAFLGGICIGVPSGRPLNGLSLFFVLSGCTVKKPNQIIQGYIAEVAAKLDDRIQIDQYVRFQVGESWHDAGS
jgi:hypothetical protein